VDASAKLVFCVDCANASISGILTSGTLGSETFVVGSIYAHGMAFPKLGVYVRAGMGAALVLLSVSGSAILHAQAAPAGRLVWSDEFSGASAVPDAAYWTYETGGGGWGNGELETYCAPGSGVAPCDAAQPNAVVKGGYLHIVARRDSAGKWTSARLTTKGLKSFQYGRIEARIKIPAGAGVWPAFWMLGDDVTTRDWPACGEMDIMENVGKEPAKIHGSVHGTGFTGTPLTTITQLTSREEFAAAFHTYGVIWSPGKVQFYMDGPGHPYATYTRGSLPAGAVWPFDDGRYFILLNLAMGGQWPGPPNAATASRVEMLVDYVRVYQDTAETAAKR
jgi:beta-glucanase (GH16 family)